MFSLSDNNQTDIIEAFISTYRYLDYLLNGRSDISPPNFS